MSFVDELVSASAKVAAARQVKCRDDIDLLVADTKRRVVDALDAHVMTTLREVASKGGTKVLIRFNFLHVGASYQHFDNIKIALLKNGDWSVPAQTVYEFGGKFVLPSPEYSELAERDAAYGIKAIQKAVQDQFRLKFNETMRCDYDTFWYKKLEVTFDWSSNAQKETVKRVREVFDGRASNGTSDSNVEGKKPKVSKVKKET